MDLRNWETFVLSGLPVVGAAVDVRDATLTHPNASAVLASTTTNADGMWEFLGLSDTPKDIKLTYLGKIKWLKGLSKHSIDLAQGSAYTPANQNILRNGGLELWKRGADSTFTFGSTGSGPVALGWDAVIGSGDGLVVTREAAILATRSLFSLKAVYTKSAGVGAYIYQALTPDLVAALRGQLVTVSVQVRQGVASNVKAFFNDSVETLGSAIATTGSFITLSAARTVGAAATVLQAGIVILGSDTVYLDNAMLSIGAGVPVYSPRVGGADAGQQDYAMQDKVYARYFMLGAN